MPCRPVRPCPPREADAAPHHRLAHRARGIRELLLVDARDQSRASLILGCEIEQMTRDRAGVPSRRRHPGSSATKDTTRSPNSSRNAAPPRLVTRDQRGHVAGRKTSSRVSSTACIDPGMTYPGLNNETAPISSPARQYRMVSVRPSGPARNILTMPERQLQMRSCDAFAAELEPHAHRRAASAMSERDGPEGRLPWDDASAAPRVLPDQPGQRAVHTCTLARPRRRR